MTIPVSEALVITIGGTNYTSYGTSLGAGFIIENSLTNRMDTATVTLRSTNSAERDILNNIVEWQEIVVTTTGGTRRFAGYIVQKHLVPQLGSPLVFFELTCQDYSCLLERTHVNRTYTAATGAAIIVDLITTYAPDFNATTYVAADIVLDTITFNRISLFDAIQQICGRTTFSWYVDANKNIHYFSSETYAAPYALSDSNDSSVAPYNTFDYQHDASQIKNRIFVYGGTYQSDPFTETFIGNASRTNWPLLYTFATLPVITVDAAAMLEGIDGIDDPAYVDVLCNSSEKVIKFSAPPSNTAVIVVTYRYSIPILARVRNDASHTLYGKWFDYKIIDRNISSVQEASKAGDALLAQDAFAREVLNISTYTPGFRSGQLVQVVNDKISLSNIFLIQRVTARVLPNSDWRTSYSMVLGDYHGDVVDLLRAWQRDHAPQMETRNDEQLNELFDLSGDEIIVSDGIITPDYFPTGVYHWDSDMYWDNFTWG